MARRFVLASSASVAMMSIIIACSGKDRPPPAQTNTIPTTPDGEAPYTPGFPRPAEPNVACDALQQLGTEVDVMGVAGAAPTLKGGVIASGTYVLVEIRAYTMPADPDAGDANDAGDAGEAGAIAEGGVPFDAGAQTRVSQRETLRVDGSRFLSVGAFAKLGNMLPPDATVGGTFVTSGSTLSEVTTCPVPNVGVAYAYEAKGDSLEIEDGDGFHDIYVRKP